MTPPRPGSLSPAGERVGERGRIALTNPPSPSPLPFVLLVLLLSTAAFAHKGSDAYWTLGATGNTVSGRFDVALRDLDLIVPLDTDGDGAITWKEVLAQRATIDSTLQHSLRLTQSSSPCPLVFGSPEIVQHSDGAYLAVPVSATCPTDITRLTARYALLFDADAQHRGLLSVRGTEGGQWLAFTPNHREEDVAFEPLSPGTQMGRAFAQGVHHIAIGWDHLCFLFALLLPSVLRREPRAWVPRVGFKSTLLDVTKVVTAFTVAHSITLGLASFGVVTPNAQWVEVAIAVSVALAAFNNLVPFVPDTRWSLAFALGLMHGFGFVAAIQDLGAEGLTLGLSVLGFNLGVETGQLAIVACFVPLAWLLRQRGVYTRVVLPAGSALILGIALFWTAERL